MTTLTELMADGVPETPQRRKARVALTLMAIATVAVSAAGLFAVAASGLPALLSPHHRQHTVQSRTAGTASPAPHDSMAVTAR